MGMSEAGLEQLHGCDVSPLITRMFYLIREWQPCRHGRNLEQVVRVAPHPFLT